MSISIQIVVPNVAIIAVQSDAEDRPDLHHDLQSRAIEMLGAATLAYRVAQGLQGIETL